MINTFLGKPDFKISEFIKDRYCDVFTKEDGTKVRPAYDAAKTMVNLYTVDDYENVKQFSFGKSYTDIDNLYYFDKPHGIDLSRTKIEHFSELILYNNNLTSFSLPDSLTDFYLLILNDNDLTSFSLPDSIERFSYLHLVNNKLTSFSLPDSLTHFDILNLYNNSNLTSFSLPDSIERFSDLSLGSNNLSSFSLPDSLISFDRLELNFNQLTLFSLPNSLIRFDYLKLDNICNLDCTACTSVPTIDNSIFDSDFHIWQGTVLVRDEAQKEAFETDEKWKQYKIEVK